MAIVTEADRRVALTATRYLVELGRRDLTVSGSQVVRWRAAGLFELPLGERRGRGNYRAYPENAGILAAEFRILLETNKNLDEALLLGFAKGLDIGVAGVRDAFWHVVRKAGPKLKRATSPTKRSERFALPAPRNQDDQLVKSTVLDLMLDRDPMDPHWVEAVLQRFGGTDVVEYFRKSDGLVRIREELRLLNFTHLWRTAKQSSREELQWAMTTARTLLDYARQLATYYEVTGTSAPDLTLRALTSMGNVIRKSGSSGEFGMAFLAPAMLLMSSERGARERLQEATSRCAEEIPRLRAMSLLAADLRESWRPCLGPGGMVLYAGLPAREGEELLAAIRSWLEDHPDESLFISLPTEVIPT